MSDPDDTDPGLAADGRFEEPLRRVSYQPGMLLGVDATRAEQDYHRRRHTRHNYWLHGAGTVVGLAVSMDAEDPGNDTDPVRVRLMVAPGAGVDGLGREVYVHEPYCIDLSAWLSAQHAEPERWNALVRDGLEPTDDTLWLAVTMRYQGVASGLQPVAGEAANAGTGPVAPSRVKDCVAFELVAERPGDAPAGFHPFTAHNALPEDVNDRLTDAERAALAAASGESRRQLELASRLLHALPPDNTALALGDPREAAVAAVARTLLARVALRLTPAGDLIVNPRRLRLDNLARPFLLSPSQLAWLARSASAES